MLSCDSYAAYFNQEEQVVTESFEEYIEKKKHYWEALTKALIVWIHNVFIYFTPFSLQIYYYYYLFTVTTAHCSYFITWYSMFKHHTAFIISN